MSQVFNKDTKYKDTKCNNRYKMQELYNEMQQICKSKTVPFVVAWDGNAIDDISLINLFLLLIWIVNSRDVV